MEVYTLIRYAIAGLIATGLAHHGYKRKSLDLSGSIAAFTVGFLSFAVSYRMGLILIVFYQSSSMLTKIKEEKKRTLEKNYKMSGNRNFIQVFANSLLASVIAILFYIYVGEDEVHINFAQVSTRNIFDVFKMETWPTMSSQTIASYLWSMYLAHYSCANGDTWASELGILSLKEPRLITSFFTRKVPRGTNGGCTFLGTLASCLGGATIGLTFWLLSLFIITDKLYIDEEDTPMQVHVIAFTFICGFLGSMIDSLLGATMQATYYHEDLKMIVRGDDVTAADLKSKSVQKIQGTDILSNEAVNFVSIALTMVLSLLIGPLVASFQASVIEPIMALLEAE
jgi:uncharacterized membrane protein